MSECKVRLLYQILLKHNKQLLLYKIKIMTRYNNRRMTLLLCHGRLHPRRLNSFVEYYSKYLDSSRAWDDATYLDIDSGCLPDILQNLLIRNRRQLKQFELILDLCPGSVRYTDKTASLLLPLKHKSEHCFFLVCFMFLRKISRI